MVTVRAFLLHGVLLLLLLAMWNGIRGRKWTATGAVLAALIALLPPFLAYRNTRGAGKGEPFIKLVQMNVMQENASFPNVIDLARNCGADLLSVQEVDLRWRDALVNGLADTYHYHLDHTANDHYGIALFSRIPLENGRAFDLAGLPAIHAEVRQKGRTVQVFAVHLRSPEAAADLRQRNRQWKVLDSLIAAFRRPTIVIGDLNTVPWDGAFARFNERTAMAIGPCGLAPTWPAFAGTALVPLDHILISPELRSAEVHTFPIPGSDHRGVSARISWTP